MTIYKGERRQQRAFLRRVIFILPAVLSLTYHRLVVAFNRPAYEVMVIPKDVGVIRHHRFLSLNTRNQILPREELAERWAAMKDTRKIPDIPPTPGRSFLSPIFIRKSTANCRVETLYLSPRLLHPGKVREGIRLIMPEPIFPGKYPRSIGFRYGEKIHITDEGTIPVTLGVQRKNT